MRDTILLMNSFELPSMYELCLMHARADRAMRSIISKQLEPTTLTMMEWLALSVVSQSPREGYSMSEVARALDVTLPQVTALAVTLIKTKLIKQKVLATDRRGRQVTITTKGSRLLGKIEQHIALAMQGWTKDIPNDQLSNYINTVSRLSIKI